MGKSNVSLNDISCQKERRDRLAEFLNRNNFTDLEHNYERNNRTELFENIKKDYKKVINELNEEKLEKNRLKDENNINI